MLIEKVDTNSSFAYYNSINVIIDKKIFSKIMQ